MKSPTPTRLKSVLDYLALIAPILCLIDCIVLPIAAALLPLIGLHSSFHFINEQVLTMLIVAICVPAIVPGYLKHRKKRVLLLFSAGISLMFLTHFSGLKMDEIVHTPIALLVSFLLIKANLENKKLLACRCSSACHSAKNESLIPNQQYVKLHR